MAAFRYRALDAAGKSVNGVVDADTARQARVALRAQGLFPQEIGSTREKGGDASGGKQRLRGADLSLLTRQWASLLAAGLTLEHVLTAAHEQAESARTRQVIAGVRAEVMAGHNLADALARYPGVFPPIYVALVRAGERSGGLEQVLTRLADHLESGQAMRNKLLQAFLYPAVVTVIAVLVIAGMMTYVVPQVVGVFRHGKQALPWLTQILIWISDGLRTSLPWLIVLAIVGTFLAVRALRQEVLRRRFHESLLRLPILGRMLRTLDSARFAQTLAILVGGGVPLLTALEATRDVVLLLPLRRAIEQIIAQVREGTPLAAALSATKQFPPLLSHLIGSGEKSGTLHLMLERAARQQQDEVNSRTAVLVGLLEPLLIVTMGGVVLLIVLAILQPIIEINQLMR